MTQVTSCGDSEEGSAGNSPDNDSMRRVYGGQLSVTVAKIATKERRCILTHCFKSFNPWSLGSVKVRDPCGGGISQRGACGEAKLLTCAAGDLRERRGLGTK